MAKRKLSFWDYLIWIGIILILGWALLKALGIINTPVWIEMIPYIGVGITLLGGAYKLGRILENVERMDTSVKELNTTTKDIDKRLIALGENVEFKGREIKRIDDKMENYINAPRGKKK
ncbi:MAG: hypothetical protein ABH864_06730 [archaeon]